MGLPLDIVLEKLDITGAPQVIEIMPDFDAVGVPRVPMRMMLEGRVVEDLILGAGSPFSVFDCCTSLTWSYVLNQFDQLVLVLGCESPFDVEVRGQRYTVDTIELDPGQGPGAAGGMDRVEILARDTRTMTILGAGFVGEEACRADCDGDGRLRSSTSWPSRTSSWLAAPEPVDPGAWILPEILSTDPVRSGGSFCVSSESLGDKASVATPNKPIIVIRYPLREKLLVLMQTCGTMPKAASLGGLRLCTNGAKT